MSTADPAGTLREIAAATPLDQPLLVWDTIRGLRSGDPAREKTNIVALSFLVQIADVDPKDFGQVTQNPVAMLELLPRLPSNGCVVMFGASRELENGPVIQAIWNLRDQFKSDGRTLCLIGPHINLPAELSQDVMMYDDPLPDDKEIEDIVQNIYSAGNVKQPTPEILSRCVTALRGLSAFAAEQCAAFALTKDGIYLASLWDRKRRAVEQTPGLRFSYGGSGFDSIGGLDSLKSLGKGLFANPDKRPGVVVFIDEIEKWPAGSWALRVTTALTRTLFQSC